MRKRYLIILLITFLPFTLEAQAAGEALVNWQPNTSRLFTSPTERAKLDSMRQAASAVALQAQEAQKEPEAESTAIPLPAQITMQGYVKRSDGKKSTVWINHQALQENSATADVQIGNLPNKNQLGSNAVSLKLPSNGQKFNLKAGQSYLPDQNRVVEVNAHRGNDQDEK
jgi:hypothetical protein